MASVNFWTGSGYKPVEGPSVTETDAQYFTTADMHRVFYPKEEYQGYASVSLQNSNLPSGTSVIPFLYDWGAYSGVTATNDGIRVDKTGWWTVSAEITANRPTDQGHRFLIDIIHNTQNGLLYYRTYHAGNSKLVTNQTNVIVAFARQNETFYVSLHQTTGTTMSVGGVMRMRYVGPR